jgi:hypothetical protein
MKPKRRCAKHIAWKRVSSFSGTVLTNCDPPFTGFFWYGSNYMMIFKGRRAHRTTATNLIARGFKALALREAPWTAD